MGAPRSLSAITKNAQGVSEVTTLTADITDALLVRTVA